VYDALGREAAIVREEELKPGMYERRFDATGMASGTYFYQLKAGRFVQTKTFVLLR
jgi:hypothetical protein